MAKSLNKASSARQKRKRKKNFIKIFLSTLVVFVIAGSVGGYFFFDYVISGLPSLEQLENPESSLASNVYTADGELLAQFYRENRIESSIDSIPGHLVDALIATEDTKYYEHWGVNLERFGKALINTFIFGKKQGGSTITMQLSKNLYGLKIGHEQFYETIIRKLREWFTAVEIEKNYTKNEILEMYFNTTYFGERAYGINMAAKAYFDKSAKDLTIPESALLVALCKSNYYYNPYKNYNRALGRRNTVMYNMVLNGYLDEAVYNQLKQEPINLPDERISDSFEKSIAPHFVEYVRQDLELLGKERNFDIHEDGLSIYTTLDNRMQKIANKVVDEHLTDFQKQFDKHWSWRKNPEVLDKVLMRAIKARKGYWRDQSPEAMAEYARRFKSNKAFVDSVQKINQQIEVGFVVMDVRTGEIKAMVGGRNYKNGRGLNHVTNISRHPGSSYKPFVYLCALENGLYPAYPLLNQKFDVDGWSPDNFSNTYSGFMTLREGLKDSKNIIAGRLVIEGHVQLYEIGRITKALGIKSKPRLFNSIALGTSPVNPLEITSAYATIANKGIYNEPLALSRIDDGNGIIIEAFTSGTREAISEESAWLITNMMETVVNEGTGLRVRRYLPYNISAAGKTGTTQEGRDAWFIGFTPDLAAAAWVGFDREDINFQAMGDIAGQASRAALPIWAAFMKEVYDSLEFENAEFELPASGEIALVDFCEESIYEMGDPRLFSVDCNSGRISDYINITKSNIPFFNSERDTTIKIFDRYMWTDTLSQEAIELMPGDSLYYDDN
ncbi:MAG: PBP1A family penicillin-binding protein [Melioribacteraceae bacterium]|nr:PBP1A family penicillin-binding protein [Melioribacteraceae bacterium]